MNSTAVSPPPLMSSRYKEILTVLIRVGESGSPSGYWVHINHWGGWAGRECPLELFTACHIHTPVHIIFQSRSPLNIL